MGSWRWDGAAWHPVPLADLSSYNVDLTGIAAPSEQAAWAVGRLWVGGQLTALALHWDGQAWQRTPLAGPLATTTSLRAVAAAQEAATAVGSAGDTALAWRWDGRAWQAETIAPPTFAGFSAVAHSALTSVAVLARDNAWAVGAAPGGALVVHWSDGAWHLVPLATPADTTLFGIAAAGPNDLWTVGASGNGTAPVPFVAQWTGAAWTPEHLDLPDGAPFGLLYSVTAVAPDDVWAAGSYQGADGDRLLLAHWDGRRWTTQAGPAPPPLATP